MNALSRLLRALWATAFALSLALVATPALAQGHGDDMQSVSREGLTIPPVPANFERHDVGSVSVFMPETLRPLFAPALEHCADDVRELSRQLGLTEVPHLEVRLVSDAEQMRALAPVEAPPPSYASGVAYPSLGLTLVSASEPVSFRPTRVRQVLRHELSHLLLAAVTAHRPVPRWFSEGLAVVQAGEQSWERFQTLALASWTGHLLPLAQLDRGFAEGARVDVAYAEASDVVAFLMTTDGRSRFPVLLQQLGVTGDLEQAAQRAYGRTLLQLETTWRADHALQFALAPLFAGTGALGFAGTGLLALGWLRKRRRAQKIRDRWKEEERRNQQHHALAAPRPLAQVLPFAPRPPTLTATPVGPPTPAVVLGILGPDGFRPLRPPPGAQGDDSPPGKIPPELLN